jgi:hypothetical protein
MAFLGDISRLSNWARRLAGRLWSFTRNPRADLVLVSIAGWGHGATSFHHSIGLDIGEIGGYHHRHMISWQLLKRCKMFYIDLLSISLHGRIPSKNIAPS